MLAELTPCLQLVAPVGMDEDSQDTWFEAALKALAGVPIGLLRRGAAAAMQKADHPSKIIPAIIAEISGPWEQRRRIARSGMPALPAPGTTPAQTCSPEEAAAICRRYGVGSFSTHRPPAEPRAEQSPSVDRDRHCRAPTRADYLKLGVTEATLDAMGIAA